VGDDELRAAVREGRAPNLAALLGPESETGDLYEHAYAAPGVLSILPSTTIAAWASVFTGEPPAVTGVPGNEWFAREAMRFYAPAPVTITEIGQALEVFTDDLVGSAIRVPTLFERTEVRAFVSLSQIHRGADLLTIPDLGDFGEVVTGIVSGIFEQEAMAQEGFVEIDEEAVESLLESMEKHGIPDLQVVYFPGVDLFTHVAEQPITDQRRYVGQVIDRALGVLLDAYRRQGVLDDTYVVFVSDHGHTPVIDDERHALAVNDEEDPPALIGRVGFRMRPLVLEPAEDERDYQATLAYQGAFAYVYLADRSTCPVDGDVCDWNRPPRLEEDVLAVAKAFDAANRTGAGAPKLLGTLDLIFARDPRPTSEDALPFQVWNGEALVPVGEYLERNPRPDLLDLEARLDGLGAGPYGHRAGDVLLLAKTGTQRPIEERFYFSGLYRSWHGSPTEQDSRIPFIVARTSMPGDAIRDLVQGAVGDAPSQLDVTPLVEALLGGE
jgi:hypothetical protein